MNLGKYLLIFLAVSLSVAVPLLGHFWLPSTPHKDSVAAGVEDQGGSGKNQEKSEQDIPPYMADIGRRLSSVPLGKDGGEHRNCDHEIDKHKGNSDAETGAALPLECQGHFLATSKVTAYPEKLAVTPGEALKVFVAMRPDQEPQDIKGLWLSPAGMEVRTPLPTSTLKITPKVCRSFWGEGCAFDQSFAVGTAGLDPGGYSLEIETAAGSTKIPFIVRTFDKQKIRILIPDWTMQAYSRVGGGSLYGILDPERDYQFDRPKPKIMRVSTQRYMNDNQRAYRSMPLLLRSVSWIQQSWSSTQFLSMHDFHAGPALRKLADVVVIIGHNEYMSAKQLDRMSEFQAAGGHVINLSGNTAWWTSGYEESEILQNKQPVDEVQSSHPGPVSGITRKSYSITSETVLGTSYAYGGIPVDRAAAAVNAKFKPALDDRQVTVACDHPVLAGTDLRAGHGFGERNGLISVEIDGVPLDKKNTVLELADHRLNSKIRVLGTSYAVPRNQMFYRGQHTERKRIGIMVEYLTAPSAGRVLGISSIGVADAILAGDTTTKTVVKNMIQYLLDGQFKDQETLAGCPWQDPPQEMASIKDKSQSGVMRWLNKMWAKW